LNHLLDHLSPAALSVGGAGLSVGALVATELGAAPPDLYSIIQTALVLAILHYVAQINRNNGGPTPPPNKGA